MKVGSDRAKISPDTTAQKGNSLACGTLPKYYDKRFIREEGQNYGGILQG